MPPMQEPQRIKPKSLGDYLEVMTKVVFQTGISWKVVENKWPDIRAAFGDFDAAHVAGLNEEDIDRPAKDPRVIRNYRKIGGHRRKCPAHDGTGERVRFIQEIPALPRRLRNHGKSRHQRVQIHGRHRYILLFCSSSAKTCRPTRNNVAFKTKKMQAKKAK